MTDTRTTERKTARRHRAKNGLGQYVTDLELIEWLGLPEDQGKATLRALDQNRLSNFPRKQPFWGDRRYLPAVQKWLDEQNKLKIDDPKRRAS
jgi:hypothetical protein